MVRLQFDKNRQYKLTLPKQIIEAKGWSKGDTIKVMLGENGDLLLKREENNGHALPDKKGP